MPNWAEQVTAVATAVGAVGLLMWKPSIDAMTGASPMFRALVAEMRTTLAAE